MKLLKKLAILTCALAAFSFVACDPSTGSTGSVEPNEPVVDAGGEEPSKATITVAVTADESRVANKFGGEVYAYLYNEAVPDKAEVFGGWPGKKLDENDELGIFSVTGDVPSDSILYSVIFNNNNGEQFNAPAITVNESKLYTRARTWIDWDGTSTDTTEPYVEPETPAVTENSTVLAIDISKVIAGEGYNPSTWTEVAVYVWGGTIGDNGWGLFPGTQFTKSEVDENIFYLVVDGKEGSGNLIFNNNKVGEGTEQFDSANATLEAGKKYLVTAAGAEGFAEWTDFTLGKLINID